MLAIRPDATSVRHWIAALAAAGIATTGSAAEPPPLTPEQIGDAFKARDWARLKAISEDRDTVLTPDGGAPGPIRRLSRDAFLDEVRDCVVSDVFTKGVRFQSSDGIGWICRAQPVGTDRCTVIGYGVDLHLTGDKVYFGRVFRFSTYNKIDCPDTGRVAPAPPPLPRPR
jgi:hypothetical protein